MIPLKKLLVFCLLGPLLILIAPDAAGGEPVTLRIGTYVPAQSSGVREVIRPWMDAVTAEVGDRVRFREFWGGSLGRDPKAQYDLAKFGILDIAWALPGFTTGQFPQIQIVELPYLARNSLEGSLASWRLYEAGLIDGLDDVHVIGIWTTEMGAIHTLKPIRSLAELDNLRIRTAGYVQANFIYLFDGAPQTMDSIEMNQALQRGTIDGVIQGWTGMRTFRTDLLTGGAYEAPSGAIPFLLIMNKTRWDALDPEVQAVMDRYGGEAMARMAGAAYDRMGHAFRDQVAARGDHVLTVPTAAEDAANKAAVAPVHADWIANTPRGRAAYDLFTSVLEEMRAPGGS